MSFLLEILKVVIIVGKNKYGYQLGVKYYNAFHINLLLQLEYVRPCIRMPITNYGHNNQSMGHQWGGNFKNLYELPAIIKGRYFDMKIIAGTRGSILFTTG
jgi:hypothetical protein